MKTPHIKSISTAALFLLSGISSAQEVGEGSARDIDINVYDLITQHGGPIVYPLVALSILTVILIFFYLFTIRKNKVVSDEFMEAAETFVRKQDYQGLIAHCNECDESMARVTERAVIFIDSNEDLSFNDVREVAIAEGSRQSGILNNRISYLSDIGSIATMMGLLGTVFGMIETFMKIAQGNVDGVQQMKVAEGVYPALITTGMGLSIGIVAMIFYSFFRGKVQKYLSELESAATHLLALLSSQHNRTASGRASKGLSPAVATVFDAIDDDFAMPQEQGKNSGFSESD